MEGGRGRLCRGREGKGKLFGGREERGDYLEGEVGEAVGKVCLGGRKVESVWREESKGRL